MSDGASWFDSQKMGVILVRGEYFLKPGFPSYALLWPGIKFIRIIKWVLGLDCIDMESLSTLQESQYLYRYTSIRLYTRFGFRYFC